MSPRSARILITAATLVLVAVVVAFAVWPRTEPRADLVPAGSPSPTTVSTTSPVSTTTPVATTSPTTRPAPTTTPPPVGVRPDRLRIPVLGVDAPVVPVGLEPDGSMELPGASEAGWYQPTGVLPGSSTGSAVLAAHVDHRGRRGVFFDLRALPEGAEVFVSGPDGRERRFVVDTRFQVDKDALPAEELFRTTGPPTLTLITCGGTFDRSVRHYRDNIVVRATPA